MCTTLDLVIAGQRSAVLIVAALAGVLCIYLGWKLYKDAVFSQAKGEFKTAGMKITLSAAGPGVFLVALGIWLLITLVNRTANLESVEEVPRATRGVMTVPFGDKGIGGLYRTQSSKPAPPDAAQSPCLLRRTSRVFLTGDPLDPIQIRDAMQASITALQTAGAQGVPDVVERASLISTLRKIAEAADEQPASQ